VRLCQEGLASSLLDAMAQPYDLALDALAGIAYQSALEVVDHTPAGKDPPMSPMVDAVYLNRHRQAEAIRAERAKRKG
jgi:hypothetical protein